MILILHEFTIEVTRFVQFQEIKRFVHIANLVNDVSPIIQLYDKRIRALPQKFHAIECRLEHLIVEIVDDVLGHIKNDKPDEERLHHLAYRCIQLNADEILGIHGCLGDHVISMLLNDCLTFILCVSELHFHPFQTSFHEFAIGGVCHSLYRFFSTWILVLA